MSLDGLPAGHVRVLLDGLPVFERHGLLLAGSASELEVDLLKEALGPGYVMVRVAPE